MLCLRTYCLVVSRHSSPMLDPKTLIKHHMHITELMPNQSPQQQKNTTPCNRIHTVFLLLTPSSFHSSLTSRHSNQPKDPHHHHQPAVHSSSDLVHNRQRHSDTEQPAWRYSPDSAVDQEAAGEVASQAGRSAHHTAVVDRTAWSTAAGSYCIVGWVVERSIAGGLGVIWRRTRLGCIDRWTAVVGVGRLGMELVSASRWPGIEGLWAGL